MNTTTIPNVKKIAVLRANALGDFIFVLPALTALSEAYPNAEIVYLGRTWHEQFLSSRPSPINRVIPIPISKGVNDENGKPENKEELRNFFSEMQKESFDIAIQLHGGGKYSNPFLKKLGAKLTVGLRTPDAEKLDLWIPYIYYQNEYLRYLETVQVIGAKTETLLPEVTVTPNDLSEIQTYTKNPYIIIHPGATDIRRRLKPSKFAEIATRLAKNNYNVYITGTKEELNVTDTVINHVPKTVKNLSEKLTLGGLTALLSKAELVIANDTGPLHLARALGTPTIGIFWCGNAINGSLPFLAKHRNAISWVVSCPKCGVNIAETFPFEPKNKQCHHKLSFVDRIRTDTVLQLTEELLSMDKESSSKKQKTHEKTRVNNTVFKTAIPIFQKKQLYS